MARHRLEDASAEAHALRARVCGSGSLAPPTAAELTKSVGPSAGDGVTDDTATATLKANAMTAKNPPPITVAPRLITPMRPIIRRPLSADSDGPSARKPDSVAQQYGGGAPESRREVPTLERRRAK